MNELEKKAEEEFDDNLYDFEKYRHGFIAGATSKYVEREKIEFAIEQLKSFSVYQMPSNERTWQFKNSNLFILFCV